jgi:4-alpha-glucanotransferase
VDIVRIDHFRGFESYWEIPAGAETAITGRWVKGPGKKFFAALERYFGKLPVIAEDLGIITPDVVALRRNFGYPGMKVLHFSFASGHEGCSEPIGCGYDAVVYSGTHDNATTLGWYRELTESGDTACIDQYLGYSPADSKDDAAWRLVELAYQCRAETAIVPLQDILGLDDAARMNTPGTVNGNWEWRAEPGALTPELAAKLAALAAKYRRGTR